MTDLLIVNSIGPGFTHSSVAGGIGGSELEIVQVAHALARRGHKVTVANGVEKETTEEGVRYIPFSQANGLTARALWIERMTSPPHVRTQCIIVRATDICCPPYDVHKPMLEAGQARLVANTKWQASGFAYAREKIIIPPVIDLDLGGPVPDKVPGRFVYASAPMKGLVATLEMWRAYKTTHPNRYLLKKAKLVIVLPGQSAFYGDLPVPLTDKDKEIGISYINAASLVEYRRLIASAEGLFYVARMQETYCCAAVFAEAYGTRPHILCLNGSGGIPEALVDSTLVTAQVREFERDFFKFWSAGKKPPPPMTGKVPDRSADALAPKWEAALGLAGGGAVQLTAESSKAGTHLGFYPNDGGHAQRYWAHERILVGGTIRDASDTAELKKLGVTHVLSGEHERDDSGKWPDNKRARYEWDDHGLDIPEKTLHAAMTYAEKVLSESGTVLYAHCRMGGSRGPTLAYIALRVGFKFSPPEAMKAIRAGHRQVGDRWTPHLHYIACVERAILTREGQALDVEAAERAVEEAYRDTPTPISRDAILRVRPAVEQGPNPAHAPEADFPQEDLPENETSLGPEFGSHTSALRSAIASGGSEMGLGLILQALVASTRATRVLEIGRFRGFSTLALAQGLALADAGWQEPKAARQRKDVDYDGLLARKKRTLVSINPFPTKEASALIEGAGLSRYLEYVDKKSEDVDPASFGPIDVLLLDGQHELDNVRRDVARYVPHVKPGGYFVLHDYYGWFNSKGENGSPIKRVIDEDLTGFERVLIDTGFASFVVFRKNTELTPQPVRVPPRADGRPTVGLVIITIGAEAATVVARAIVSAWKMVDAVTVVIDPAGGGEKTAEVARHIGADVYLRPSPKYDYETGIGAIAGARNEALAIAERKTDYVLMLDADDTLEGEIPKELTHNLYEVPVHDANVVYRRFQLWKSARGFRYHGIIHEALVCTGSVGRITTLKYMRRFGGGHQDSVPASVKYGRHARLVSKWLIDHPEDSRAQFYLAQSYRDAGQGDNAIAAYEKRIEMTTGNDEERAFSAMQIARIIKESGKDPTAAYLRSFELRPTRAEPLYELASWLREGGRKRFALAQILAKRASEIPMPINEALFIDPTVYQWKALEEYAVSSYWIGDKKEALRVYEDLRGRVPEWLRAHIENMLAMCRREA